MRNVRLITWIGLVLSVIALSAIPFSLLVAIIVGACGMLVNTYSLITSPDPEDE